MDKLAKYLLLLGCAMLCTGCGIIKGSSNSIIDAGIKIAEKAYPEDNAAEEFVEDEIEKYTGITLDLSPASPEKD